MARLAVLASGSGSNFQALVEALALARSPLAPKHACVLLIHDRKAAFAASRAESLGIPSVYIPYAGRSREDVEADIREALAVSKADIVALAGFMRILSPFLVTALAGRIVNIHPSLLPAWPGRDSIRRAYEHGDRIFGVTVHYVDEGTDTGAIIAQDSFEAPEGAGFVEIERRIHEIEYAIYPRVILELLDSAEQRRGV